MPRTELEEILIPVYESAKAGELNKYRRVFWAIFTEVLAPKLKEIEQAVAHALSLTHGKDGRDGINGKDGRNGIDGKNGTDGKDGKNGIDGKHGKDGLPGRDGINGRDGQNGVNGKDATINTVVLFDEFVKRIQTEKLIDVSHLRNGLSFLKDGRRYKFEELMKGASSKAPITYDLSSQCNGVLKTFTIPAFTSILGLTGTDAPIVYRPTTDFSASGTTLTLLTVNAPSLGSTLLLSYVPIS